MNNPERSDYLLILAEELGISLEFGVEDIFEDTTFFSFVTKVKEWSPKRNTALINHLKRTSKSFRCLLPYSKEVFAFANDVLWYLDEVIVPDPVERLVNEFDHANLEIAKSNLRYTLQILNQFRQAIESGYLLLYGTGLGPPETTTIPIEIEHLLQSQELLDDRG
jgi:hypothetical protein